MTDQEFTNELRKWWSFDDGQQHTHSWHSREDFIEKKLPELLTHVRCHERLRCASFVASQAVDYLSRADRLAEAGANLETVRLHEQAGAALEATALNLGNNFS